MKVAGAYRLAMPRGAAYALLQDPLILARCMPGCESLEKIGEDEYAMRMKMVMASRLRQVRRQSAHHRRHPALAVSASTWKAPARSAS